MLSIFSFLVVNLLLFVMLTKMIMSNGSIDSMFLGCLLFTFIGNVLLPPSINLVISAINLSIGIRLWMRRK